MNWMRKILTQCSAIYALIRECVIVVRVRSYFLLHGIVIIYYMQIMPSKVWVCQYCLPLEGNTKT